MKNRILIFLILFLFTIGLFVSIYLIKNKSEDPSTNGSYQGTTPPITVTPTINIIKNNPLNDLTQGGWIPDWAIGEGLEVIKDNPGKFESISPVLYEPQEDGSIKDLTQKSHNELFEKARANDVAIIPSVALFDPDIMSSLLNTPEYFEQHVSQLVSKINIGQYDGIDINYETIYLDDQDEYFELLNRIKNGIGEKTLSVTVLAKWGDDVDYHTFPQTRKVFEYDKISDIADEIRIMSYDYTFQNTPEAGGISPISWYEDIAKYAAQKLDVSKTRLGAHIYAYEWEYDPETFITQRPIEENIISTDRVARALTLDGVDNIKKAYPSGNDYFDEQTGEQIFTYKKNEKNYVIFYQNNQSLEARKKIAAKYGFAGLYYWRLGGSSTINF